MPKKGIKRKRRKTKIKAIRNQIDRTLFFVFLIFCKARNSLTFLGLIVNKVRVKD